MPDASTFGTNFQVGGNAILTGPAGASLQLGAANVNGSPVAQTLRVQSPLAGSASNTAGANWTLIGGLGTGTGTGGDIIFQTNVKTTTGSAQGTATTAITIKAETQSVVHAADISWGPSTQSAAAWTTSGIRTITNPGTFTDTSSSGTVTAAYTDVFGASTIVASSATTYTNYWGAYFAAPVASTNVTFTQSFALAADSIYVNNGLFKANGAAQFASTVVNAGSANGWELTTPASTATVPTLLPNRADTKAGIGGTSGNVSIVADNGGTATEMITATGTTIALKNLANTATTSAVCYNTGTGVVTYDGTLGTCTVSDERLKNVGPRITNALGLLLRIDGFRYTYKDPQLYGFGEQIGVGAQHVEAVFPELVNTDAEGIKSLAYEKLSAPIIEALREIVDSCRAVPSNSFCGELLRRIQ
jgi:hypothetical protein